MEWIKVSERLPEILPNEFNSEGCFNFLVSVTEKNDEFGHINTYAKGKTYMCLDRFVKGRWSDGKPPSFRTDRYYGKGDALDAIA